MNALRAAVAPAVGPLHRDGRGPQGNVIGDYRTLEPQAQQHTQTASAGAESTGRAERHRSWGSVGVQRPDGPGGSGLEAGRRLARLDPARLGRGGAGGG
jgi:hypothetical protein